VNEVGEEPLRLNGEYGKASGVEEAVAFRKRTDGRVNEDGIFAILNEGVQVSGIRLRCLRTAHCGRGKLPAC
jgi:hypothetical protein